MFTKIIIFSVFTLFSINAIGQNFLNNTIPKDSALADFEIFKSALISGHPGIYWYKDKESMALSFDNAKSEIKSDITNKEFHKILTSVMSDISCGHSTVLYPASYTKGLDSSVSFFPFKVMVLDGKLFITKALNSFDLLVGAQIISINNKTADDILKIIESKISTDKGINTKKIRSIDVLFPYYYSVYVENVKNYDIVLISPKGQKLTTKVKAIAWDKNNMFRSLGEYAASQKPLTYSINNNTAELTISSFGVRNYKKQAIVYEDTITKIFQELNDKSIKNLIIDLRGNNGGSLSYGELLFSYLANNDIMFYKNNIMNVDVAEGNFKYKKLPRFLDMFEKELGPLQKENGKYIIPVDSLLTKKPHYLGKVYFITDGLSFSSTSNFLALCKENNIGTIIGETPGGAYQGCNAGGSISIPLPHSGFRLYYYIIGIRLNVSDIPKQIEIDYSIPRDINDIINSKSDKAKEFTMGLISE